MAFGFTLSGPGVDRRYPTAALAVSVGINRATGAGMPPSERPTGPATFYIRDRAGVGVAHVERQPGGTVTVWRAA
jgi:hypothetical protein